MTDEAYVFNQTNRERAIVKRSASHKKNGSKSKKCKLGVDGMSKKEIEAKHGDVKSWKMTEFYDWKNFKEMPDDIQVEYINHLIDAYDIGLTAIGAHLFKISKVSLLRHFKRRNLESQIHKCEARGGQAISNVQKFIKDLSEKMPGYGSWPVEEAEAHPDEVVYDTVAYVESDRSLLDSKRCCSMSFSTEYITGEGVDHEELSRIEEMFSGRKIRVSISIEAV